MRRMSWAIISSGESEGKGDGMEKLRIVVATKNKKKLAELIAAFDGLPVELVPLSFYGETPDAVEDGETFEDNAVIKAKFYSEQLGVPAIADDSGLTIEKLGGAPGVYSARYCGHHGSDEENNAHMVKEMKRIGAAESRAAYECALAFVNSADGAVITSHGSVSGLITLEARGEGGFGYDPYFYMDDSKSKTMAELTPEEKDAVSHRGEAIRAMRPLLEKYLQK